jgi:hypothetical protein
MAFTAGELANIANAVLDFYLRGPAIPQSIQERPLYDRLNRKAKTFPGGKGSIRVNVKGDYTTTIQGYSDSDTVTYANPANIKQAAYPWKEIHAGIQVTLTELKMDGISISDTATGEGVQKHDQRDLVVITSLLTDKLDDLAEGYARDMNRMFWQDGTQSAKEVPGVRSIIRDAPATGTVGGLDSGANAWWRNRVSLAIASDPVTQALSKKLRQEVRQLQRYGGKPNFLPCGSAFLDALDAEVAEKGYYTDAGFAKSSTDIGIVSISMNGVGTFIYDPTLDTLSLQKYCFFIDDRHITLRPMQGEDRKTHSPHRPPDKYVLFRALTWTGGLTADQLNCHGVYSIA